MPVLNSSERRDSEKDTGAGKYSGGAVGVGGGRAPYTYELMECTAWYDEMFWSFVCKSEDSEREREQEQNGVRPVLRPLIYPVI